MSEGGYPFATLPDYIRPGMRLLFVGINPAVYAVQRGHYFARKTNRFWPAFSRSRLSAPMRQALGRETLLPEDDSRLLDFGIGFTDVVKIPSRNASLITPADYREWAPRLLVRIEEFSPQVACFNGVIGYRAFLRYVLGISKRPVELGPQPEMAGSTRFYVVPSPSPANAHFRLEDQIVWYDNLSDYLDSILGEGTSPGTAMSPRSSTRESR